MSNYFTRPITNKSVVIQNRKNIKCDLSFDVHNFNKLLETYRADFTRPFTIICALADTYGFGDVIFFTKFVKYLYIQYAHVKIVLVVSDRKKSFISSVINPGYIYNNSKYEKIPGGNEKIELHTGIIENNELKTLYKIDGDILFIAPKTNMKINITYTNPEVILNNSYTLSEYNPINYKSSASINTGVNNTGLLLNNYKNSTNMEKMLYSVTYIYTGYDHIIEYTIKPSRIKFKINKDTTWNIYELFNNLNMEIYDYDMFLDEYYESLLRYTDDHDFIVKIKLLLAFRDYLHDLDVLADEKVKIYYRGDSVDNLKKFIDELPEHFLILLNLRILYEYFFVKDKFIFEVLNNKTHDEMIILYEYSLPIIFISGDQSISDFISVNKYYNEYKHGIYYQIFSWKQNLADSLGCKDYVCCKIHKSMLNDISEDPEFDFRYTGMLYVKSLLLYALQYKLRSIGKNIKICKDLDSNKSVNKLMKGYSLPNFKDIYVDYITNGDMNNNLRFKIDKNKLFIEEGVKPFKISMILGSVRDNKMTSWLMGTEVPDLYIKYNTSEDDGSVKLGKYCNNLSIDVSNDNVILPDSINTLLVYIILEQLRHERFIDNNLVRTYGSFIITNDNCDNDIKTRFELRPENGYINTLLFQENVYGKYITLKEYLHSETFTVDDFNNILDNIVYVIAMLQSSKYKIVHNNLLCEYIYINFKTSEKPCIKITHFDMASFSIKEIRFSCHTSKQKDFFNNYDYYTFFNDLDKYFTGKDRTYLETVKINVINTK